MFTWITANYRELLKFQELKKNSIRSKKLPNSFENEEKKMYSSQQKLSNVDLKDESSKDCEKKNIQIDWIDRNQVELRI